MFSRFTDAAVLQVLPGESAADSATSLERLEEEVVLHFDQCRVPLLRYLSGFGLPLHDREEVLQEVFLALFQHLRRGKSRENLRGWLFRVAHNLALKDRERFRRDVSRFVNPDANAEVSIADTALNPEDQLARAQIHQRLHGVLEALPEQDRRCLALRAEGLRYREIAEILDMSLGAVSISLSRSLARMTRAAGR